jgi:hypothetical protein
MEPLQRLLTAFCLQTLFALAWGVTHAFKIYVINLPELIAGRCFETQLTSCCLAGRRKIGYTTFVEKVVRHSFLT